MTPLRILAISGSLRERSANTEVLLAAAAIAPAKYSVELFRGLSELPHFNPDLDGEGATLPPPVQRLRSAIATTDALLISSPEYAHGVPGCLKNALDWLVSGPEMVERLTGLLTASERAVHAPEALKETLQTMSATLVLDAIRVVPLDGKRLDATGILADASLATEIGQALRALGAAHVARGARAEMHAPR